MLWIFVEAIPTLDATARIVGLGALALGVVPMVWFWRKRVAYYRTPGLQTFPDPSGEPAVAEPTTPASEADLVGAGEGH
jgi:hypothetical protein